MSWHNLPLNIEYLEYDIVNNVYDNIVYLKDALESYGYSVNTLTIVNAQVSTPIVEVVNKLLGIEDDLTKVCDVVFSPEYRTPWTLREEFILADYQRWVLILNDLYSTIIEDKGKWGVLQLSDCIPTINSLSIVIRGDSIA